MVATATTTDADTTPTATSVAANDDILFDRKIAIACEGLRSYYYDLLYNKIPLKENALTLAKYIISMKSEINLSNNYRIDIIEKISRFSIYYGKIYIYNQRTDLRIP
jgi:hypothetical protein